MTFTMADGKTHTLRIGEDTPTEGNAYAMLDGDKRLFTIASFGKTSLDKQSKDLREKHLLVFDQDKLSRVELDAAGKPPLEFGRAGTDWQILKPKPMRADGSQVDELVSKLKDASMDSATDPTAAAPRSPAARSRDRQSHRRRRHRDPRSPQGQRRLLRQIQHAGRRLQNHQRSRRRTQQIAGRFPQQENLRLWLQRSNRIEIKDGGQSKVIEKSGENWTSGGKTMDSISVQNLIDKLRDLASRNSPTADSPRPLWS